MTTLFIYFTILLIGIAVYNAYFVLEITGKKEKKKFYSNIWHFVGLEIRLYIWMAVPLIILLKQNIVNTVTGVGFITSLKWSAIFALFGGLFYDIIINLIRYSYEGKPKLTYVDYKGCNKFFVNIIYKVVGIFGKKIKHSCTVEKAKDIWFWTRIGISLILLILLTV